MDILQTLWPALFKIVKVIKICPWEVEAGGAEVQGHLYRELVVNLGHTRSCLKTIKMTKPIEEKQDNMRDHYRPEEPKETR